MMDHTTSSTDSNQHLVGRIKKSALYVAYEKAFRNSTGLPLSILPARGSLDEIMKQNDPCANRFCRILCQEKKSPCKQCVHANMEIMRHLPDKVQPLDCFAGLRETVVPVKLGQNVVAYLKTGQIRLASKPRVSFDAIAGDADGWNGIPASMGGNWRRTLSGCRPGGRGSSGGRTTCRRRMDERD